MSNSLYLYSMDQKTQEDYIFNTIQKYNTILLGLLEKKGDDPLLWLKSCKQAGKLKACINLGIVNDSAAKNSILVTLENHKQTTQLFIAKATLENRYAATKKE